MGIVRSTALIESFDSGVFLQMKIACRCCIQWTANPYTDAIEIIPLSSVLRGFDVWYQFYQNRWSGVFHSLVADMDEYNPTFSIYFVAATTSFFGVSHYLLSKLNIRISLCIMFYYHGFNTGLCEISEVTYALGLSRVLYQALLLQKLLIQIVAEASLLDSNCSNRIYFGNPGLLLGLFFWKPI